MFCPKCGKPDQTPETYCRECGLFLPDLNKLKSREHAPEMHIKASAVLSIMTIVASLSVALLLFIGFYGREIPVVIYTAIGLLIAMAAWQIQTFWRTMLLRRQLKKNMPRYTEKSLEGPDIELESTATDKPLTAGDFESYVMASVTDRTTKHLVRDKKSSS